MIDAIARELEVSPMPVREAIRRLEAEGWVFYRASQGARVAPLDEDSWQEVKMQVAHFNHEFRQLISEQRLAEGEQCSMPPRQARR